MACPVNWLLLFIIYVGAVRAFARDFWNIDCGGNETFVNDKNLTFEADDQYIRTGLSRAAPNASSNEIPREISTMRVFPAAPWKKSCYKVPVEQGAKVLVRTKFYYGNYDGRNSPPNFRATFGTTESCEVATDMDLSSWSFCEVVYVTTENQGTDICFIQTEDNQFPIVSTIEVRRLPPDMYGNLNFFTYTLFRRRRFAFGASETIEYPDDVYNRRWSANTLQGSQRGIYKPVIVKRDTITPVATDGVGNSPPMLLFQAAAVAPMVDNKTAANLTIRMLSLPSDPIALYLTMYFTEPLANGGSSAQMIRTFDVYMDGKLFSRSPIQLPYGFATEYSAIVDTASNETVFDLVPANGSTLPPAISGMEIFQMTDTVKATEIADVEALSLLQSSFKVFRHWTGDPCLPTDYTWEWVGCKNTDNATRINKLLLNGYQLSGNIPNFSALDALEVVNLSNNSFSGSVPEFLASLPNLQSLDLSDNDFDSIPSSLRDNKRITLITEGNPELLLPAPKLRALPLQHEQLYQGVRVHATEFTTFSSFY